MHDSICKVVKTIHCPKTAGAPGITVQVRKSPKGSPAEDENVLAYDYDLYGSPVQAGGPIFIASQK